MSGACFSSTAVLWPSASFPWRASFRLRASFLWNASFWPTPSLLSSPCFSSAPFLFSRTSFLFRTCFSSRSSSQLLLLSFLHRQDRPIIYFSSVQCLVTFFSTLIFLLLSSSYVRYLQTSNSLDRRYRSSSWMLFGVHGAGFGSSRHWTFHFVSCVSDVLLSSSCTLSLHLRLAQHTSSSIVVVGGVVRFGIGSLFSVLIVPIYSEYPHCTILFDGLTHPLVDCISLAVVAMPNVGELGPCCLSMRS